MLDLSEVDPAPLIALLRERDQTVATAESLTAGLVTAVLTSVPGASAVVRGGLVVYATELKARLAGVDPDLLAEHGAVHPEVARQLARGARERCGADWGIGLTGVAGPDPQDGVAPGTVHIAVTGPSPNGNSTIGRTLHVPGGREAVRQACVHAAIMLLSSVIIGPTG
nr:CinA family protein [Labedaea rhizosphaerae]